jgi:hypothetical protein
VNGSIAVAARLLPDGLLYAIARRLASRTKKA